MHKHTSAEMGKSGQIQDTKPKQNKWTSRDRENCDFFRDMSLKIVTVPENRDGWSPYLKGIKTCFFVLSECPLLQPTLLQATLALSLVVSSLKSVCCDFSIFSADAPIARPLFNRVRNSVIHSPSSLIRDPRYGNVFTCSSYSF